MSRMRVVVGLLAVALVAGCGSPTLATVAPATKPTAGVAITGDVKATGVLTNEDIAGLPQQTVDVTFASSKGEEKHAETGVLLSEVISPSALATTDRKNDLLSFAVLAIGADGYTAAVSYGEVSPDFGNRGVLIATAEDGKPLDRPRLVVPGDVKGGRYVSELVELKVVRLPV